MAALQAARTLVKSNPELWAECSDAASLARHLGGFGEIRITKLEPETAVAWEGDDVSGTVRLEPSGWGTRVVLTARMGRDGEVPAELREVVGAQPSARAAEPRLAYLRRVLGALKRPRASPPAVKTLTIADSPPTPLRAALDSALDSLGRAHHRPYSRA